MRVGRKPFALTTRNCKKCDDFFPFCWIQTAPPPLALDRVLSPCIHEGVPAGRRSSGQLPPPPVSKLDGSLPSLMPILASFWISQADAIYAVVSTSLLLAVVLLVLRPGNR